MKTNNIGNLIYSLRTKLEIPQKKLCYGLCSDTTMSRIELGERIPDKFLLDALLQRLGKSPDKFFAVLTETVYLLYTLREKIEEAIGKHEYEYAKELLALYCTSKEAKESLHQQFIFKIKAIITFEYEHDMDQCLELINQALNETLPGFAIHRLSNYRLSRDEALLILMRSQMNIKYGNDPEKGYGILTELLEYIDINYTDEEEKTKIYPKAAYLKVEQLMKQLQYFDAEDLCGCAIDLLTKNGVIVGLVEFLQLYVECLKQNDNIERLKITELQYKSLLDLFQEYEITVNMDYSNVMNCNTQNELFLMDEVIKNSRMNNGLSQENLSGDICAPETISRIETGKRKPNSRNFKKLQQQLGLNKDVISGYITVDDFTIHEKKREIERNIYFERNSQNNILIQEIKESIDTDNKENVQYLLQMDVWNNYNKKQIDANTAIIKLTEALKLTLKEYGEVAIEQLSLSTLEVNIINKIAIMYYDINDKKRTIKLLSDALRSFEISKVDMKYHSLAVLLIMQNLEKSLEECDFFEEAIDLCNRAIILSFQCGRGNMFGRFVAKKGFTYERKPSCSEIKNKELCAGLLRQAYYLSGLMTDMHSASIIKRYYNDNYKEFPVLD